MILVKNQITLITAQPLMEILENGDGLGGMSLDPTPAPVAHTSQMMSDSYLFGRITEGGTGFETGMLPYRDILSENHAEMSLIMYAHWEVEKSNPTA